MARDDADDDLGSDTDETNEWKEWPEAKGAAAMLEITQRQLLQYVRQNKLTRWRAPDGSWRYRPEDLENLRDQMHGARDAAPFEGSATISDVLAANVALLKQAHDHIEALMRNVTQPMAKGLEFVTQITSQQAETIKRLEESQLTSLATRERLLSEEEVRQLLRQSEAATQRRKNEAWGLLMQNAPKLLTQLGDSLVGKNPEAIAAAKLINSLDPMFVEAFVESDMLDAEQKALLRVIIARNAAKRAQEKADAEKAKPPANDGAKAAETPPEPPPPPSPPPAPPAPEAPPAAAAAA